MGARRLTASLRGEGGRVAGSSVRDPRRPAEQCAHGGAPCRRRRSAAAGRAAGRLPTEAGGGKLSAGSRVAPRRPSHPPGVLRRGKAHRRQEEKGSEVILLSFCAKTEWGSLPSLGRGFLLPARCRRSAALPPRPGTRWERSSPHALAGGRSGAFPRLPAGQHPVKHPLSPTPPFLCGTGFDLGFGRVPGRRREGAVECCSLPALGSPEGAPAPHPTHPPAAGCAPLRPCRPLPAASRGGAARKSWRWAPRWPWPGGGPRARVGPFWRGSRAEALPAAPWPPLWGHSLSPRRGHFPPAGDGQR